jgi:hypothetical protein
MALKKSKNTPQGPAAEYWRIVQLNTNFDRLDAVIDLALYTNKAAREAGAQPFDAYRHDLGEEFAEKLFNGNDKVKNINLQKAYTEFKQQAQAEAAKPEQERNAALAWFADAEDV